jgi:hypothetical protein
MSGIFFKHFHVECLIRCPQGPHGYANVLLCYHTCVLVRRTKKKTLFLLRLCCIAARVSSQITRAFCYRGRPFFFFAFSPPTPHRCLLFNAPHSNACTHARTYAYAKRIKQTKTKQKTRTHTHTYAHTPPDSETPPHSVPSLHLPCNLLLVNGALWECDIRCGT